MLVTYHNLARRILSNGDVFGSRSVKLCSTMSTCPSLRMWGKAIFFSFTSCYGGVGKRYAMGNL